MLVTDQPQCSSAYYLIGIIPLFDFRVKELVVKKFISEDQSTKLNNFGIINRVDKCKLTTVQGF